MRLFFIIMILTWTGQSFAIESNPAKTLFKEGISFIQRGEFPKAIKKLEEAQKLNPENTEILYQLGNAYYNMDQIDRAQNFWKKAAVRLPEGNILTDTLLNIISRAEKRKILLRKIHDLEKLIAENPDKLKEGLELASLYRENRQFKKASLLYRQISKFHPSVSQPYVEMAGLAEKEGHILWAETYYKKAVELDPADSKTIEKIDIIQRLLEKLRTRGLKGFH